MKVSISAVCLAGLLCGVAGAAPGEERLQMEVMTVTGTREAQSLAETPSAVGIVAQEAIRQIGPTHPQQILGQIPGVAIGVTNGEGHTTAIRQPFTTSPLYLFLEDGIPTRATGFFNHNALYEVNIPAAAGIEVVRGPGTSLYGSDAIGGIVNILTASPAAEPGGVVSGEAGSHGWYRLLGEADTGVGRYGALHAAANVSHTDGWRDGTAYDRLSGNLRWDYVASDDATFKTILGVTRVDMETGANSPLIRDDYRNNPTKNNFQIAYRDVEALRLSTTYDRVTGDHSLLSVTPYLRKNFMELNASFLLSFDPTISKSDVMSYGVMSKWRRDFPELMRARVIVGLDVDYSPGSRTEDNILVDFTGAGADRSYDSYTLGTRIYDYDVTYKSASPYLHVEFSPTHRLRATAGLRYDAMTYEMSNNLDAGPVAATITTIGGPGGITRNYHQLEDASVDFSRVSPNLGLTYAVNPANHLYFSYSQGFRTPSEGQLFRAGGEGNADNARVRAENALELKPIKAEQLEIGMRGDVGGWVYDAVAYVLTKEDDLVSQRDLETNATINLNAGETRHRGVELGLGKSFAAQWRFDTAVSYARHTYEDWVTATEDYSGNEISAAPRLIANTRLSWRPVAATTVQLEWVRIGSYWLEDGNAAEFGKYDGHDLLNLRVRHAVNETLSVFGRIMNISDERYADSASVSSNTPVYSPGLPRTYYAGVEARW